ncbi:MAG: DUF3489 domain-containing protein [Rhodoferax sp.]|nr:DUF3489 domain-containing protein [Rhodoferax sp.]
MTIQLTPAQQAILTHAHDHTEGKIIWLPDNIKGGARVKVIEALAKRWLITAVGQDWFITEGGYDALGVPHKAPIATTALGASIQAATTPRTRDNSKQARVIAMLKRPDGATIDQICEATGWQAHTVRGTFAGAFKKKLGLNIASQKATGEQRVYRIAS